MSKKLWILLFFVAGLSFVSLIYLKKDKLQQVSESYIQTVVFQDQDHELIPISINIYNKMEMEMDIRNKIDLMQSSQLQSYGLYPILDPQLEVQSIDLDNRILTVSFNDYLYSNQNALNIIEALTFVLTDYDEVEQLRLQINGEDVNYLPNSMLPLNHLTKQLGLNNFEEASTLLHQSIPVMVYREKNIENYLYYVPTTIRINENEDLEQQVQTILNYIDNKIHLLKVSLENQTLELELDSNILLDNEKIDRTLEELIVLSLKSMDNVLDVEISIDGENARNQETSQIHYNYIKI